MHEQEQPFNVTLADGVEITITRIYEDHQVKAFQLSIDGKYHGEVYPDHENAFFDWRSSGEIDQQLATMIGRAIERYDA
jgi:hypothetical protein